MLCIHSKKQYEHLTGERDITTDKHANIIFIYICSKHIKEPLLLTERVAHVAAAGFLSRYLNGPLLYV